MRINKKHLNKILYVVGIIGAALAIFLILAFVAYGTNARIFQNTFPAAIVQGQFITLREWADAQDLAYKFDANFNRKAVFDGLIQTAKEKSLAESLNLSVGARDMDAETVFLQSGQETKYDQVVNDYFNNQRALFRHFVVLPRVYDAKLRIKYNEDQSVASNATAFARAQSILAEIKAGAAFDTVAAQKSDDKVTAQLGGDLGFVSSEQLIPEVGERVKSLPMAQVADQITVSRYGYHILYPIETAQKDGKTVYHIKQILVETTGYDDWLSGQVSKLHVWRIVKP